MAGMAPWRLAVMLAALLAKAMISSSVCAVGYCGIIFVMFSAARRLEVRQNKRYGKDPDYQKFVRTVPILLPFVPLYSVEKYKWLVA